MMTSSINRWAVGDVVITQVIEFDSGRFPSSFLFPNLNDEYLRTTSWLHPHYVDDANLLKYSVHAFVLESKGKRIIIDTCIGNDKPRSYEAWNRLNLPFLDHLAQAGFATEAIDYVLCTHLHMDHVGWNTRLQKGEWVPTFPNARYLFGKLEWKHWTWENRDSGDMPPEVSHIANQDATIADSVLPIVRAGLHDLVETDHRLTDEVSLTPTPGHTPGHVSVRIASRGREAVITGDVMHNPFQVARPDVHCSFDDDQEIAKVTRQAFVERYADRDTLILGTHFPVPSVGHIVTVGGDRRFIPVSSRQLIIG